MNRVLIFDPSTWAVGTGGTSYLRNVGEGLSFFQDRLEFAFFCHGRAREHVGEQLERHFRVTYSDSDGTGARAAMSRGKNLRRAVDEIRPDVVLTMNQCDAALNVPVITFLRNRLYFETGATWFRRGMRLVPRLKYAVLRRQSFRSIRRSSALLFPTDDFGRAAMRQVSRPVSWSVAQFGLNREVLAGGERDYSQARTVLSLHYNIHKNYALLWRAMCRVWEAGNNVLWRITDDLENSGFPSARALHEEMKASPYFERIEFLGKVNQADMGAVYAEADLLAYPTLCESFGHGLVEAMGNGMPCVASDIGVNRELAGEAALYADAHNADAFGDAIQSLLTDGDERVRLGQAARERSRKFSWERHAASLVEAIENVAESAARKREGTE